MIRKATFSVTPVPDTDTFFVSGIFTKNQLDALHGLLTERKGQSRPRRWQGQYRAMVKVMVGVITTTLGKGVSELKTVVPVAEKA